MSNGALMRNVLRCGLAAGLVLTLSGCGAGSTNTAGTPGQTQAQQSDISISASQAGVTPFIASVQIGGQSVPNVASVTFTISPMPNSVSLPVRVSWSRAALSGRGYLQNDLINLPVFGLYAGYQNLVSFLLAFTDGSVQQLQDQISTQPYTDPTGIYLMPMIIKARAPGSNLGFNFFIMKSGVGSPVIVDTDGQVRWVVPGVVNATSSYFADGEFMIGSQTSSAFSLLQFDGTQSALPAELPQPLMASFTHNIDSSPKGVLAEFSGRDDLGESTIDIVADITPLSSGAPIRIFDMADILRTFMQKNGDDASAFVRPGIDWFHVNASTYDPNDSTVIVSSRENFLIKVNYSTHDVIWIFGDPTKYWYTFPSLRTKALTLAAGGNYPIGQHGVSITSDGYIMVMNDGQGSLNQPSGEPAGLTRTYSEVSVYSVNTASMTAQEVWDFNYGQSIFGPFCGSSYEASGKTYLVDFATAESEAAARLIGLDSGHNVVFDFQYASPGVCAAGWNAIPIPMENLLDGPGISLAS